MYKIILTKKAEKEYTYLYKTNKSIFKRVRNALQSLAENPMIGKRLKLTLRGKWSYRIGTYRILYSIEHKAIVVYILDIGHRREIYG